VKQRSRSKPPPFIFLIVILNLETKRAGTRRNVSGAPTSLEGGDEGMLVNPPSS
jgi:hypothetical protein